MENNIIVEYPKNANIKFLFTSYPTQELKGRERVVQENLRLPFESKRDMFIVVETDISDLSESLQEVLKQNLKMDESDTLIYRVFNNSTKNFSAENDADIYSLVYSDFDWQKKSKNNKMN